jgi:hypothetical protein
MGRDGGRTMHGMSTTGAAFFRWEHRYDIRDSVESRLMKGLASSQATRETKVAHSTPQSNEPRRRSHRRDRPGLLDNMNVDIVPAIVNGSSWDHVGIYRGDTSERERKNQGEESDHREHFPS